MKTPTFIVLLAFTTSAFADMDYGLPVSGQRGFVKSPYAPNDGYIDVRGYAKDSKVKDPYSKKTFLVPEDYSQVPNITLSQKTADEYRFTKLDLEKFPIAEALNYIGEKADLKVHYTTPKDEKTLVTLRMSNVAASDALYYAAKSAQLKVIYKDDGVYFAPKPAEQGAAANP